MHATVSLISFKKLLLAFLTLLLQMVSSSLYASTEKIALLIGNSKYTNLGVLDNTPNDARSVEKSLKEIGYKTRVVLDADELTMRRAVRSFAAESAKAEISVIFYAGHGAQINGENYLLPIDLDVPNRESDIQLSGVKVDDLVNSIKSKTKVIFLDACRDNPSLSKSLTKGRGGFRGGLAAPKASVYEDVGNLFIAYATDSGNIALDGVGQRNSPFTTALLKHIKQPISIDDMFSLVTKEVRLATKNTQKPFKYASLEGVVCLTGKCGVVSSTQEVEKERPISSNESQEYALVSGSADVELIKNFIEKYPRNQNREQLSLQLAQLSWGWKNAWVLYDFNQPNKAPSYIKPDSIKVFGDRRAFDVKWIFEAKAQLDTVHKDYAYHTYSYVIDCKQKAGGLFQTKAYGKNGEVVFDSQTGDPKFIKLDVNLEGTEINPNSLINLVCMPSNLDPIVTKSDLSSNKWERLFSYEGIADYLLKTDSVKKDNGTVTALVQIKFRNPKKISDTRLIGDKLWLPVSAGFVNVPVVKSIIIEDKFICKEEKYRVLRQRYFDTSDSYVGVENLPSNDTDDMYVKVSPEGGLRDLLARLCD